MQKAAQKPSELNINLLPKDDLVSSSTSAVHWVLTIGRYLIIVTEIVAISTFLLGIYLAKEKNDLKGSIQQKQAQVKSFQTCDASAPDQFCEDRFRKVQEQINQVATIRNSQFENNQVLTEFAKLLPIGLSLDSLGIDQNNLTFSGSFPDPQQLQTMINSFNTSPKISALDITSLSKDATGSYKFTAAAAINAGVFRGATN